MYGDTDYYGYKSQNDKLKTPKITGWLDSDATPTEYKSWENRMEGTFDKRASQDPNFDEFIALDLALERVDDELYELWRKEKRDKKLHYSTTIWKDFRNFLRAEFLPSRRDSIVASHVTILVAAPVDTGTHKIKVMEHDAKINKVVVKGSTSPLRW